MVHCIEALVFFAPLEQREVDHPQAGELVLVTQAQLAGHFQTQFAKLFARLHRIVAGKDQNQVARFCTKGLFHLLQYFLGIEFIHARLHIAVCLHTGIYHALCTDLRTFHKLGQRIQLLARIRSRPFRTDTADISSIIEYGETVSLHDVHQFDELHIETQVRLVASVIFHGIVPTDTRESFFYIDAPDHLEQMLGHSFENVQHVFLLHKAHFAVDLCKFGLAVRTQVFVTETFHDLEITVETGNHQQLLQRLRRLRQSVELSGIHTGRHDKVTRPFRRRVYQHRSFDFQESMLVQIVTHLESHTMTQFQVLADGVAAQIQITVFHTQVVPPVRIVFNRERRSHGSIQDIQFRNDDFDLTGRDIRVFAGTFANGSRHLDNIFASQLICFLTKSGIHFLVKHQLRNTVTVADIHERHATHLTGFLYPAGQRNHQAFIGKAQVATCSCSIHYIIWIKLFFFFTCAKIIIYRSQEYLKWHLNVEKSFLIFLKPFFNGETHLHFS